MKKLMTTIAAAAMLSLTACSASTSSTTSETSVQNDPTEEIVTSLTQPTTNWNFTSEAVSQEDLDIILAAAVNTPSAINAKPWQFNVITDPEIIAELADTEGTKSAPVMIITSVDNSNEMKILDAGLATERMEIVAQLLGYSTKIETAPARTIRNDETGKYAELFNIDETMSARSALYIGVAAQSEDAQSGATETVDTSDYVIYSTAE